MKQSELVIGQEYAYQADKYSRPVIVRLVEKGLRRQVWRDWSKGESVHADGVKIEHYVKQHRKNPCEHGETSDHEWTTTKTTFLGPVEEEHYCDGGEWAYDENGNQVYDSVLQEEVVAARTIIQTAESHRAQEERRAAAAERDKIEREAAKQRYYARRDRIVDALKVAGFVGHDERPGYLSLPDEDGAIGPAYQAQVRIDEGGIQFSLKAFEALLIEQGLVR